MTEQTYRIPLTKEQVDYLTAPRVPESCLDRLIFQADYMEGPRDAIEHLGDELTVLLATVGFDKDYSLTSEGELLERLLDALHVERKDAD
jgi:hypothetical protein